MGGKNLIWYLSKYGKSAQFLTAKHNWPPGATAACPKYPGKYISLAGKEMGIRIVAEDVNQKPGCNLSCFMIRNCRRLFSFNEAKASHAQYLRRHLVAGATEFVTSAPLFFSKFLPHQSHRKQPVPFGALQW